MDLYILINSQEMKEIKNNKDYYRLKFFIWNLHVTKFEELNPHFLISKISNFLISLGSDF